MSDKFHKRLFGLSLGVLMCTAGCDNKSEGARASQSQRDSLPSRSVSASPRGSDELINRVKSLSSKKDIQGDEVDALYNRLDLITPQEFDEVWNSLRGLEISTYLKYRLLSRCLHGLALAGEFDKALALAKQESVSANRITLLSGVFGGARGEIQTTISKFEGLSQAERAGVVGGLAESLASCGKLSLNSFAAIGKITPELKSGLISGLDLYAGQDITRLRELKEICESIENQAESNAGIFAMVLSFRAAEHLELVMGEFKTMDSGEGAGWKRLITELTKRNPEGVMETLMERNNVDDVRNAVSKWSEVDYSKARDWFLEHKGYMNSKLADGMLSEFVEHQLKVNSVAEAYNLIRDVADESQKARLQGRVWSCERDQLRAAVSSEPAGTIRAIVEGKSYSDYWLEEAMGNWVSRDFEAASNWYEKNWSSLPKEKAQYVAAAFATQAIGAGDVKIAQDWAALIQDAKTKARIEAAIAKASEGK